MSEGSEKGLENLGDDRWQLSDGRIMTGDEIHEALLEQFRQEDLEPERALRWAQHNKLVLEMLYRSVLGAAHGGRLLKDAETVEDAKKAIDMAHGEVLGETFAGCVADIEHMSAVAMAAISDDFYSVERHYKEAAQNGLKASQAFVNSPVLSKPEHVEGIGPKNFVQALIVTSIVKWLPIRAQMDGKRFFVNPASKDYDVLRKLHATEEGQDWINMAYARSEHDTEDIIPDL